MLNWDRKFALGLLFAVAVAVAMPGCGCRKKADEAENGEGVAEQVAPPDRAEISDSFKHAGYRVYGLDFPGTLEYTVVTYGLPAEPGTSTYEYIGLQDGFPTFRVTRSGALGAFGTQTLQVREDGVYVVQSSLHAITEPAMELPADFDVDKVWNSEITVDGSVIRTTNKVEAKETITVPAGEFEAYRVVSTSTVAGQQGAQVSMKAWLVPDVGYVMLRSETIPDDANKVVVEMQLAKITRDEGSAPADDSEAAGE